MQFFFRTAMFSWLFSSSYRIINVYQFFFTVNILFDKGDSHEVEAQKKHHLHPYFLKTVTDDLN